MAQDPGNRRPTPPGPRAGMRPGPGMGGRGKPPNAKVAETAAHAKEVREVARGRDIVERPETQKEQTPAGFGNADMLVVRSWMQRRPLEAAAPAAALVHYPRLWTTKRGRYCRFQAPGAGNYGLVRARPTF